MLLFIAAIILFILAGILIYYLGWSLVHGRIKRFNTQNIEVRKDERQFMYWSSLVFYAIGVIFLVGIAWQLLKTDASFSFSLLQVHASKPLDIMTILLALIFLAISIFVFFMPALQWWRRGVIRPYFRYSTIEKDKAPLLFWFFVIIFILGGFYMLFFTLRILGIV